MYTIIVPNEVRLLFNRNSADGCLVRFRRECEIEGLLNKKNTDAVNKCCISVFFICRGTRIRTWDPLLPKQVR